MEKKTQVYIKQIALKDYKCFKGENVFSFVHNTDNGKFQAYQWTVLLGNNGTGKTNLLKAIANMEPVKADYTNQPNIQNLFFDMAVGLGDKIISKDLSKEEKYQPKVIERYKGNADYRVECSFIYTEYGKDNITKTSFHNLIRNTTYDPTHHYEIENPTSLSYSSNANQVDPTKELDLLKIYAYGVSRVADKSGLNTTLKDSSASLFSDNVSLLNFEDWLLQLELAKAQNKVGASRRLKQLENIFKRSTLFPELNGFKLVTDKDYNNHIEFEYSDGSYRFEELGYGYQCMLAWIFDFSKRMFDRYPHSDNPLKEAAVVIIDEIDLHLHPKWQSSLLHDLSEFFPNTQFIVSTHSPLIVQSIEGINLYVLKRDKETNGIIAERKENTNWEGWQMEEILGEIMDVDNCYTSEQLKKEMDEFDEAVSDDKVEQAEAIYKKLINAVNPNGTIAQMLNAQIRELRNYHEAY